MSRTARRATAVSGTARATRRWSERRLDEAFAAILAAGGEPILTFDIAIGRSRIRDPFGNIGILDQSKGQLVTDAAGQVTGVRPRSMTTRNERR